MAEHSFLREGRLLAFASVLAPRVAGWHDGSKASIDFEFVNDAVVVRHEEAHETIFRKTPDGILLAVLLLLLDRDLTFDAAVRQRLTTTADTLFHASRVAHEIAATYIGIKTPAAEIGRQTLPLLPEEYRRYYYAAADVLDPHFRSSYLQVAVLSTLAHYAFGSMLLRRFSDDDMPAYTQLAKEETPNWRLTTLLKVLADGKVTALRDAVERAALDAIASVGAQPWDLHSDEAWSTAPQLAGHTADLAINARVVEWIEEQALMPYLHRDEAHRALQRLSEKANQLGLRMTVGSNTPASAVELPNTEWAPFINEETRAAAFLQAGSVTSNPAVLKSARWSRDELWNSAEITGAEQLIVLHPDPYAASGDWILIASGGRLRQSNCIINGLQAFAASVAATDFEPWLETLSRDEESPQSLVPALLILAYPTYEGPLYTRWKDCTVHYLVGNWAKLIDTSLNIAEITSTVLEIGVRPAGEFEGSNVQASFHLRIAHGQNLLGPTFRALGELASNATSPLDLSWESHPNYKLIGGDAARKVFNYKAIAAAFGCIAAFWSFF